MLKTKSNEKEMLTNISNFPGVILELPVFQYSKTAIRRVLFAQKFLQSFAQLCSFYNPEFIMILLKNQ